jgi:hypothetical protein
MPVFLSSRRLGQESVVVGCTVDYSPESWRQVEGAVFERFLKSYPRPFEAHPPLDEKAGYREYRDSTPGEWPNNAVAKTYQHRRRPVYVSRTYERAKIPLHCYICWDSANYLTGCF